MQAILLFIHSQWLLVTAFGIISVLLLIVEWLRLSYGAKRISPAQATHAINHQDAIMIDIRSSVAFKTGHIVGAISIPLDELEKKPKKLDKYKSKSVIIVDAQGLESPHAAHILTQQKIHALILAGGIRSWREADMPLTQH